ncbi:MAG: alpha/beta hydrolase [Gallionellaceae bacterium]|jgi:pimeloyl-ACP methyl ester carboxylesterase
MNKKRIIWLVIGCVIATALGVVTYLYQRDIDQARGNVAGASKIVQTACGQIEYAEAGEGSKLLVVHGAGGGFDQGLDIAAPFIKYGFHVIAPSRFGYLRTPLPENASAADQADAHACLLDALHIERIAVIGVSAGAPSTLQFALRHPKRISQLVLMVPGAYAPSRNMVKNEMAAPQGTDFLLDTAMRSDFLFWAALKLVPDTMTRVLLGTDPALVAAANQQEQQRIAMLKEHILPVSSRRLGLLNDARVMSALEPYALENITVPVLATSAKDDGYKTYEAARYTTEQIRGARFVGFEQGGHMLVGHDQQFTEEVLRFLGHK